MALSLSHTLTPGTPENITDVQDNFDDVVAWANGTDTITSTHIAPDAVGSSEIATGAVTTTEILDGTVADTDLASPNNGVWRAILQGAGVLTPPGAGTFGFPQAGTCQQFNVALLTPPQMRHLLAADYAVAGKTTKLRLRAQVNVNATAPTIDYTVELRPVTAVAGGAGNVTYTVGAATTSVVFTTPAATSLNTSTSTAIDFPADGLYALAVTASGASAVNHTAHILVALEMRHV